MESDLMGAHCKLQVGTSGRTWMTVDEDICSATCISDAFLVMQILCDAINKTLDMASYFSFSFQLRLLQCAICTSKRDKIGENFRPNGHR